MADSGAVTEHRLPSEFDALFERINDGLLGDLAAGRMR
jgi:hypothetical protein